MTAAVNSPASHLVRLCRARLVNGGSVGGGAIGGSGETSALACSAIVGSALPCVIDSSGCVVRGCRIEPTPSRICRARPSVSALGFAPNSAESFRVYDSWWRNALLLSPLSYSRVIARLSHVSSPGASAHARPAQQA